MIDHSGTETRLGTLAVRQGWVSDQDLDRLLKVQQHMRSSGVRRRIGQMMVLHDLISPSQLNELLQIQTDIRNQEG